MFAFLKLLPAIIELVKVVEELLPTGTVGAHKAQFVLDLLSAAGHSFDTGVAQKVIATVVSTFNALGIFKTSK